MSEQSCRREAEVVEAAKHGRWSPELENHVSDCRICAAAAQAVAWMGRFAARVSTARGLPDANYLWLKSLIEQRSRSASKREGFGLLPTLYIAGGVLAVAWAITLPEPGPLPAWRSVEALLMAAMPHTSPLAFAMVGATWLAFPALLAAAYLWALRPLR